MVPIPAPFLTLALDQCTIMAVTLVLVVVLAQLSDPTWVTTITSDLVLVLVMILAQLLGLILEMAIAVDLALALVSARIMVEST